MGNYAIGVVAGNWGVNVSDDGINGVRFPNYVFSQVPWDYNNGGSGSNITSGQAVQANFYRPRHNLSNHRMAQDDNYSNPIVGIQVNASANINNTSFQTANAYTDINGNYVLNVVNTNTWHVGVNCCSGNNCDNSSLPSNYQCPSNNYQGVSVDNMRGP